MSCRIEAASGCIAGESYSIGSDKIDCRSFAKSGLLLIVEKITSDALPLVQAERRRSSLQPLLQIRGGIEPASDSLLESRGQIRSLGASTIDRGVTFVEHRLGNKCANREYGRRAESSDAAFKNPTSPAPVLIA
jgi:hypothetical protein